MRTSARRETRGGVSSPRGEGVGVGGFKAARVYRRRDANGRRRSFARDVRSVRRDRGDEVKRRVDGLDVHPSGLASRRVKTRASDAIFDAMFDAIFDATIDAISEDTSNPRGEYDR